MALKRPVAGDPVTVEDFGQPIYDLCVPTAWTNITLLNTWVVVGGYVPQYRKIGDRVSLRGRMSGGTAGATPCFNLPVGFRPYGEAQFPMVIYTTARVPAVLLIRPSGDCSVYDASAEYGLDSVNFSTTA